MLDDGWNHLSLMCNVYIRWRGNFKLCSNIVVNMARALRLGKIIFLPENAAAVWLLGISSYKHPFLHCVFHITVHCSGEAEPHLLSARSEGSK